MNRILILNNLILPFVTVVSLSLLLIEAVTYPGFIAKHIIMNPNIVVMINLIQMTIFIISKKTLKDMSHANNLLRFVFNLSYLLLPVFLIIYTILLNLEVKNFPNYVYSTVHIDIENFFKSIILLIIVVLFGIADALEFRDNKIGINGFLLSWNYERNRKVLVLIFAVFVAYQILFSVTDTVQVMFKNNIYILNNRDDDYDQKMYKSWHFFYKYIKFVIDNTPSDAKIAIPPPERPWLSEGNSVLVRYFLYPRYLITVENEYDEIHKPDYYLLAKGIWKAYNDDEYGWPREKINAEEIIYFDPSSYNIEVVKNVTFDPNLDKNKYGWGLIKVKRI